jgi:hypothetical protein
MCTYCEQTHRRAYSKIKKDELTDELANDPQFATEFRNACAMLVADMEDMSVSGGMRIKRRKRTVETEEVDKSSIAVKGVYADPATYRDDHGDWKTNGKGHKLCNNVYNPLSCKKGKMVFIPNRKHGYFDGSLKHTESVGNKNLVDDERDALKDGQLIWAQPHFAHKASLSGVAAISLLTLCLSSVVWHAPLL